MSVAPLRRTDEGRSSTARKVDPLIPTIFHEPWWLEAATAGQIEEVTVESGGRTVGRLPFVRKKKLGLVSCVLPEVTPFLGPAVDEGSGGMVSRTLRRHQVTRDLIEKLPAFNNFFQLLHRDVPDALPFLQHGFTVEPHFTFEVPPAPEVLALPLPAMPWSRRTPTRTPPRRRTPRPRGARPARQGWGPPLVLRLH